MLQITDLDFGYGNKPLYEDVNFIVGNGQKVGITGPNGSGKSTLLSIIMGEEDGYTGKVKTSGKIALVPQEIKHDAEMDKAESVRQYVDQDYFHGDFELKRMFNGLELNIDLDSDPKTLSAGQKTKLALARTFFQNPDILLLDEPTNFMDKRGKAWVMEFLSDYQGSVVVISHDLELMDSAIDKILAITPHNSRIDEYKGTYSDYLRLKGQKDAKTKRDHKIKTRHLKKAELRYNNMRTAPRKAILRRQIERERQGLPEMPQALRKINIRLPEPKRIGELPIKVVDVNKSYEDLLVLDNISFSIYRNERIVLIGPNGSGKSTLIKILMGLTSPDSGDVENDSDLSIGYYSQEFETFDFTKTVIETFCEKTNKGEEFARGFLGRYMFSSEKVFQKVGSLSGGEKTRLSIATLTGIDNNLLILDEPTTYLDVLSQRIVLESLKEYKGTMIVVSHTPEFIEELGPQRAFLFPEQRMVSWDKKLLDRIADI